jgi:DNA-binding winged helix-turn-helix (wHTH) protein/tetratricopeptide (TPR) repeat protein
MSVRIHPREKSAVRTGRLEFEGFRLDPANARLWRGDEPIALAPKPFDVLCRLVECAGELVTKDELLEAVWSNLHVSESSLSVAISALRSALGDDPGAPRYIQTVSRRGYRFISPVTPSLESEQPRATIPAAAGSRPRWRVGRTAPLETLESALQQSLAGNRQVVFITGEAGIGKTTFIEMAMERMSRYGLGVLWGRCTELFGTDEAFLPLIEALNERCSGADGSFLLKLLRDHAPTWLAQLPRFIDAKDRAALQNDVFGATRERMLREFCDLMEVLSADRPWVFIFEDLHWSDYATLDALSRLARREREARVFVLATYRPIDVSIAGHPISALHHDLQIHGRSIEIAVDRRSRTDVKHYLTLRFGTVEMIEALADRVFRRSQGQPLFVVALVDYFVAQGSIVEVEGRWMLAPNEAISQDGMPHDLQDMITRQIDRLTADEQRLLEVASAAGAEFSASLPACVLDRDLLEVEQVCERLARSSQVIAQAGMAEWPDGTVAGLYAFQHALYQDVLYQRLPPGQRVQTHRRLGDRLEAAYGEQTAEIAAVLALHFEEGRDYAKAVRYLAQAAAISAKRFSNREAVNYLSRALELVDRLPAEDQLTVRARLLYRKGLVRWSAGDLPGSLEDLKATISCAAEANQLPLEVTGLLSLNVVNLYADRSQCLQVAERVVARSQALDDVVLKAWAQANSAHFHLLLRGWRDEDVEKCRYAVMMTAGSKDPRILMGRSGMESVINLLSSNYRHCCRAAKQGRELAQANGDIQFFTICTGLETFSFSHLGEWRLLRQSLPVSLAMTERNTNRVANGMCHLNIAALHVEALDFEGARQRCEEALDLRVEANPYNFFLGRTVLAKAHLGLRDLAAARMQFDRVINRIEVDGIAIESPFAPYFYNAFCEYWLTVGDMAKTREQAMRLYEMTASPQERTYLSLAHRFLAKVAIAEGDLEEAKTQLSQAVSILEQDCLPLAAWRVYLTASELYERHGETSKAAEFRCRSEKVIQTLASNFDQDDPLRSSLIAGFAAESWHLPDTKIRSDSKARDRLKV